MTAAHEINEAARALKATMARHIPASVSPHVLGLAETRIDAAVAYVMRAIGDEHEFQRWLAALKSKIAARTATPIRPHRGEESSGGDALEPEEAA